MNVEIEASWKAVLNEEFKKPYFKQLAEFVKKEYKEHTIYPKGKDIFKAFAECKLSDLRVVIIGQDPYHGQGQANGLCFSVNEGVSIPPSLRNIFKELKSEYAFQEFPSGDLSRWAKQGVFLLNATLTVRAKTPGSHQKKGWEEFTDAVIKVINDQKEKVVFLLWGAYAQQKGKVIDTKRHLVLTSPHPSPFSAHRGFLGNNHFKEANSYLERTNQIPINWA